MTAAPRWMLGAALILALDGPAIFAATTRCTVDPDQSIVGFSVAHMIISKTTGRFTDYVGRIEMDPDAKTIQAIEAVIRTASVNTNNVRRDTHLKSPDFFNVERYPTMTWKMTSYEKQGNKYVVHGPLTLLGVRKEITLVGTFNGTQPRDLQGHTRAGFTAEGALNRKDFGMTWNKTLDSGGLVVGDDVAISLEIECLQQK
jgi:polyisoprenoid-binding protein YceI